MLGIIRYKKCQMLNFYTFSHNLYYYFFHQYDILQSELMNSIDYSGKWRMSKVSEVVHHKNKDERRIKMYGYFRYSIPYFFIAPFISIFLMFFVFPAIYSIVLSFYQYRGYGAARFIGLQNYRNLLQYSYFWTTMKNIAFYYFVQLLPLFAVSFLLALIFMTTKVRFKRLLKASIFLPQIMAFICTALVWRIMLSTRSGLFPQLFGISIPFLEDPVLSKVSVVLLGLWRGIGWYMVIFLAGLTNISADVLDASRVDGSNAMQRTFYVIIPLMKPTFLLAMIINAISVIKMSIEPNILLSGWLSVPDYAATPLSILLSNMQGGSYGMASALGWLIFILIFILSMIQYRILEEN